jgi:uncharacterized protein YegP (UPF0339 family)
MKEIDGYPKIYNLGHKAVRDVFKEPVVAQEKVDGSQISFMKNDLGTFVRSKGAMLYFDNPEKMFAKGLEVIFQTAHELVDGWVYRGEYLQKPKHNVLQYDRVPMNHIILYDIQIGDQDFLNQMHMADEAERLGFEAVPAWHLPADVNLGQLSELLLNTSCLGGVPIEGIVMKNYERFDPYTGKVMMAKHVSEAFREVHRNSKGKYRTSNKDVIQSLIENYKSEARWQKAVQHLKESGALEDSPTDIGMLINEVHQDVYAEEMDEIKKVLFKWAWKQIGRGITAGLPEWYKEQLLVKQFEGGDDVSANLL